MDKLADRGEQVTLAVFLYYQRQYRQERQISQQRQQRQKHIYIFNILKHAERRIL